MPKDTKTLGNSKARACESLGFVHKKGCARVLTQPHFFLLQCFYDVLYYILKSIYLNIKTERPASKHRNRRYLHS